MLHSDRITKPGIETRALYWTCIWDGKKVYT